MKSIVYIFAFVKGIKRDKMKNLVFTFALVMTLICSAFVLNSFMLSNNAENEDVCLGSDLSQDNGMMCDLVFDANGSLISRNTYIWDSERDSKGMLIESYTANVPSTKIAKN